MDKMLKLKYPIIVEKGEFCFTLNSVLENESINSTITFSTIGRYKAEKQFNYRFKHECEAIDEVLYLLDENINRCVLFDDLESESSLLDILVSFDRIKKQLTGEVK